MPIFGENRQAHISNLIFFSSKLVDSFIISQEHIIRAPLQNFKKKSQKWNILKYPIIIMHLLFGQVSVGYFLHSQAYT